MDKMTEACRDLMNLLTIRANTRRYKSLQQILTKYANDREWNPKVSNDTEFKAIREYKSIPIATVKLEYKRDGSTFSFEPSISGYLEIYGLSGKLTTSSDSEKADIIQPCKKLTRSSQGIIEESEYHMRMRFENIPSELERIIQTMIIKIDKFSNLVKLIKQIQVDIPCTMEEYRNNPANGEFMTTGSSKSFEANFTIENETCIYSMKSKYANRSAQTSSISEIIQHIQCLLLDDCHDILSGIKTKCPCSLSRLTDSVGIYSGEFTYGFEFTFNRSDGRKFGISIERAFGQKPCIILRIDSREEQATRYKVFYGPTNREEEKGYQYITINDVEQVSKKELGEFLKSQ